MSGREIKFRAWDRQNDQMVVDPAFIQIWGNGGYEVMHDPCGNQQEESYWHDDADIMQWTGLLDKNGKEIYEGDKMGKGIVKWVESESCFMLIGKDWEHDMRYASQSYEVIGNLFEKPHHSTEVER